MNADATDRLVKHIRAVNAAQHGYPYSGSAAEQIFAKAHLPRTKEEFAALVSAVRATGWFVLPVEVAAILVGTTYHAFESAGDRLMLCDHKRFDLTKTWGVPSYRDPHSWPDEEPGHACTLCGGAAYSRANLGWACMDHYDALS